MGCILANSSPWLIAGALGVCVLMFRSFAMMHEAVHGVAASSRLNDYLGIFYGGIAFLAFEPWKKAHIEHHFWSGNADKDPVMVMLTVFPKFPPKFQNFLTYCWMAWFPILGILQHMVFWMISIKKGVATPTSLKSNLSLAWPLTLWATLFLVLPNSVITMTLLPGVFIYLVLTEFVNLPHHLRLPQKKGEERLHIWEQHESARSCLYPKLMEQYVTLNFNYHTEHHMFPDLPWYDLPKVHSLLKEALGPDLNVDAQFAWTTKHRKEPLTFVLAKDLEIEAPGELAATGTQSVRAPKTPLR